MANTFAGLSSLRAKEAKDTGPKPPSEQAQRFQDYLAQQYGAGPGDAAGKPKKKKKVKREQAAGTMRIVDNDVTDQPVVANPEEAVALRRQAEQEREMLTRGKLSAWETVGEVPAGRRARHDSPDGNDASPPRRRAQTGSPEDASPPRRRQRHDSPEDASPPRRRQRHDSPEDASPPRRRQRHDSPEDASPPRRGRSKGTTPARDASPPRRRRASGSDSDADASPPRRPAAGTAAAAAPAEEGRQFMSDGTLAGMVSGREIQAEMARKKEAETRRFAQLGAEVTGHGAETVYRDKGGQRLTRDEFVEARAAERRAGKAQYDDESQLAWGGGLKQKADREDAQQRMREEAARPFARGHDAGLDAEQRERARWGDPMAHLVKKKVPQFDAPASLVAANQEAMKKSGFVIPLEVPQHSWLRRGVGPPANRYNIKPGRHWDGVDRSNGFERDMFKRQTELRRREQEARMMSQGDM